MVVVACKGFGCTFTETVGCCSDEVIVLGCEGAACNDDEDKWVVLVSG